MSARQGVEGDESCDPVTNLFARESKRVRVQPYERGLKVQKSPTASTASPETGKVLPYTVRLPASRSVLTALYRVERDCNMMSARP